MRVRESAINPLIAHAETKSTISYFIKQLIVVLTEFVHFNPIHIHGKKFNMYCGIIIGYPQTLTPMVKNDSTVFFKILSHSLVSPIWSSTSNTFSILEGSINGEVTLFSTARTTPSEVCIPIAVDPS